MADAFSLAINIFTLLEFGRKVTTLALGIHKDGEDSVSTVASLDLTSKDLGKIAGELSQPLPSPVGHNQSQAHERIQELAMRCVKVTRQMQETISGLGLHRVSRKAGKSVVKALKYKWKQSDILAFQSEIEDLRSQLMLNLILWIRTGMMESLDNQDRMIQDILSHDEGLKNRLDHLGLQQEDFVHQIVEILSCNAMPGIRSNDYSKPQALLKTDLMNAMRDSPQNMEEEDLAKLKMPPSRLAFVRSRFIGIFRYDSMFDREAGVAEAHPNTLKWIFKDTSGEIHTWDNFSQWLESNDQLYWITGKMGSGKSTLMKYIAEGKERRCTPYLRRWAENQPLFIATFYFWAGSNEESRMQTSVEGLYRTLLAQMLEAYPECAPHVSPRRWEDLCLFNTSSKAPAITELKDMLSRGIEYVTSKAKVCLFIDGLDEFEGEDDDLQSMITWVKNLVGNSPVKLCVASQPWRVFEDALQDRPHLLMEDFNHNDIQQYVSTRFHDDPNFKAREQMEAAFCTQLLDEIVTKAEGVFLWVHLVCTDLLQAMSKGDLIGDLMRTLNALPVKMEKLYGHILDNLDRKDHAAQYFLLLQAFLGRPDALLVSFADYIGEDSEFSLQMSKISFTNAELQYRVTELRKRLNSRCRGLLSLSAEAIDSRKTTSHLDVGTVQYFHRSVKDYLALASTQRKLIDMLDQPFDPHLRLCSAHLARWKCCTDNAHRPERKSITYKCVQHAAKVVSESNSMMLRILDGLDPDFELPLRHEEAWDHFGYFPWFGGNFLSFTVVLGLEEYVKYKISRGQGCVVKSSSVYLAWGWWVNDKTGRSEGSLGKQQADIGRMAKPIMENRGETVEWPLLLDAILSPVHPNAGMVSLLLENGANPNLIIRCADWTMSAFDVLLLRLRSLDDNDLSRLPGAKKGWLDSVCLLLQHGAQPDRSDLQFLRKFVGEDVFLALKLPRSGRHRESISKCLAWVSRVRQKVG